jgi:hypothetical protein
MYIVPLKEEPSLLSVKKNKNKRQLPNCRLGDVSHSVLRVWVILIVEDPSVTVKCGTPIKVLFCYFNVCTSEMLNSLSSSFTSISFLIYWYWWGNSKELQSEKWKKKNSVLLEQLQILIKTAIIVKPTCNRHIQDLSLFWLCSTASGGVKLVLQV